MNVWNKDECVKRLYLWMKAHLQNKLSEHTAYHRSVNEVDARVVTGNSVVEIGESTIGRCYIDPVREVGVEHVAC